MKKKEFQKNYNKIQELANKHGLQLKTLALATARPDLPLFELHDSMSRELLKLIPEEDQLEAYGLLTSFSKQRVDPKVRTKLEKLQKQRLEELNNNKKK